MIERSFDGDLTVSCDFCSSGCEELPIKDWNEFLTAIREAGWCCIQGDGSDWLHICPSCNEDI